MNYNEIVFGLDHSRNIEIKYLSSLAHSPAMGFSVCHLAMGLLGLANISDQCFNSAFVELQPTSTQPAVIQSVNSKHNKSRADNTFASQEASPLSLLFLAEQLLPTLFAQP